MPEQEAQVQSLAGKKILIIEDDLFLLDLLSQKLSVTGVEILHAANVNDALTILKSATPNLIVTDLVLPERSGFEFIEAVKADPQYKSIPVVVLSNLGQKKDIDRATELGVLKFLTKVKITPAEISKEVVQLLS